MTDKKPAFAICESSPQAKQVTPQLEVNELYPFNTLTVGQSFTCKLDEINWKSLRICVYQRNKRAKARGELMQFKFIKHDDLGVAEVARIA